MKEMGLTVMLLYKLYKQKWTENKSNKELVVHNSNLKFCMTQTIKNKKESNKSILASLSKYLIAQITL